MKTVVVYNASWSTFGGGEKYMCTLADTLSCIDLYKVALLVDRPSITREALEQRFNLSMEHVDFRICTKREVRPLIRQADIGVVLSNFRPFGNQAKKNVYMLQIPYPEITPLTIARKALRGNFREATKDILRHSMLTDARNADLVLINSPFVSSFLQRYHDIHGSILYPPIDDFAEGRDKENVIVSVGRFFRGLYNDKRYDVLVNAFKRLRERLPHTSWMYHIVGSCGSDAGSQRYLEELRASASGHPIYFHVNSPYDELRRFYSQAQIFWHAAGYDVDEECHPERTEHFGMSTVEAMSAGCVPVVANKGGQKEIVSHGKSGYVWNTLDELLEHTASLINNPGQRSAMQQNARQRFQDFDRQHFSSKLISLFKQLDED